MQATGNISWYTGCSGFHYKEWKNTFYPPGLPQKKWFAYYCEQFNSLEVNNTFYRFPELSFLQNWFRQSPAHFRFAVKVPRLITHYKKFEDTGNQLKEFYNTAREGLQHKLACVLFQLPPQLSYDQHLLRTLVQQVSNELPNVIEFRHNSWWRQEVYEALADKHISFCSISYPGLPGEIIATTGILYYRFHGIPKLYVSAYTDDFLQNTVNHIRSIPQLSSAYLFFNNTAQMAAINNARFLQNQLTLR